ncbi:MAG TPA: efflux RND transporter periplasmic adaptor subunit [Bryobacteraceae bacterium]|jgi:RND family efflux transporter MFP subunit|nr:efflux RND transporter periplasmic adaptor subunit [Bryobacteraceae bacterium]
MRPSNPYEPDTEERLREENRLLRQQLEALKGSVHAPSHTRVPRNVWRPSNVSLWSIALGAAALLVIAFFAGYIPLQKRKTLIGSEAVEEQQALPRAEVTEVIRSPPGSELELPGNIQAITEAPILARASGYVQKRLVDIGDRVKTGQDLAEIEAPELKQQVLEATATFEQSQATLDEALANYEQGKTSLELARATARRWSQLVNRGVVSVQENDQYQSQYQAQLSSVHSLEKAIAAQKSGVAAATANLSRLQELQGYLVVKAPFDGLITLRNLDTGALVTAGETLIYRIAQIDTVRTYVNVPQTNANSIRTGQTALLTVSNLPGRVFNGVVARTANSLDPNTRTMLVEIHVPNKQGVLFPGMYAQVDLNSTRANPPLLIPSDALVVRPEGTEVAVLRPDHTVHLQQIQIGRDYGDRLEILSGLQEGDNIIHNPGDLAREDLKVNPIFQSDKAAVSPGDAEQR